MEPQRNKTVENPLEHKYKYKCALCPYSTTKLYDFQKHGITHSSDKPFKCPECPYKSKRKQTAQAHLKNVHLFQSPSSRPFPCPESDCNYAAKHKGHLNSHSKIHSGEKSFFCTHPNCNYSTDRNYSLTVHTRVHTGEKPFVCQFESCSYATVEQSKLVIHMRTHTKERPFKCHQPNCEYSASNNDRLKRHQLTHKPKEGEERPSFSCTICQFSTTHQRYLTAHIKSHTLEKFFKCDEPNCNFEGRVNVDVKKHKVVHSEEKPFACPVESCEFRCKIKWTPSLHLKTHSDERRYKCELCLFRGKTRQVVNSHLKNIHSDLRPFKCRKSQCASAFKRNNDLQRHVFLIHKQNG